MMNKNNPTALVILDGFGYSAQTKYNAIHHAFTPHFDEWFATYPHAILQAAGSTVGLLDGYIGNSEVGHLTIGAGRVVDQPVKIIHQAIEDGSFFTNKTLVENLQKLAQTNKTLHIMGLLSDAGVHSHIEHLFAFITTAHEQGVKNIVVHAFLDGRDVPPQSAAQYLEQLETQLKKVGGSLGSVHGRFYAMDRDNNWERIQASYLVLTQPQNITYANWQDILKHYYKQNITDEFITPSQFNQESIIKNGDGIVFFNFRPDRARQLTQCFVDQEFDHCDTQPIDLEFFITPVSYTNELKTTVLYSMEKITNTLKEVLAKNSKSIFSIAETEKYAHVTYFFNGGKEEKQKNETWKLIPSITAKDYVNTPGMSAPQITAIVLESLKKDPADFYLINYANADMVGHSGNMGATVKAVECLDYELGQLYDQIVTTMNGTLYITADHGNAEDMYYEKEKQPRTAHTTNPVPFIMIKKDLAGKPEKLSLTQLTDIAPFILKNFGIKKPNEMN